MINRIMVVLLTVFLAMAFVTPAIAGGNQNKKCQNVHGIWVDCSTTTITNVDDSINNSATGGAGGNASAKAYGGDANVNIGNGMFNKTLSPEANASVKNDNRDTNINMNGQDQDQAQLQGQKQDQGQLQGQTQSADNIGNHQSITIKEAKNPVNYGHISPDVGKTDADLANHARKSTVRLYSAIFKYDTDSFIDIEEARSAMKWNGIDVSKSLLSEPNVSLKTLNYADEPTGVYFGSLTLTTDDATMDQMIARACLEAMKLGATGANFIAMDAESLSSSKYGIDLGGSASVAATQSGSTVLAPGSTLGWSKAKSDNKMVPELFVEMFHDVSKIVE